MDDKLQALLVTEIENEIRVGTSTVEDETLDALLDMLECVRSEKDYEWLSDNFLPEFAAILLTDASTWAGQMFSTRDFIEAKLEGNQPNDADKAWCAKTFINKTLNTRDIFYYLKYIRSKMINSLVGVVWAECYWVGDVAITGDAVQELKTIKEDRFDFEVYDPRNVFTPQSYCYSAQQKPYIIFRKEVDWYSLQLEGKKLGYMNLDKIADKLVAPPPVTESNKNTGDIGKPKQELKMFKNLDLYVRYGKLPVKVNARNEKGEPVKVSPGWDIDGKIEEEVEGIECIVTMGSVGGDKYILEFAPTPFYDANGKPFKPAIRGLCYPHPTKDTGLGDGKYMKEMQVTVNDMLNLGFDRIKLATLPTMVGKKYSLMDNDTVYFAPEHVIELENVDDLKPIEIRDNPQGTFEAVNTLTTYMERMAAVFPTTMGQLPSQASTTATAVAGAEQRTNMRGGFKNLTYEYTFNSEFFWMMLQMAKRFMQPETGKKMLGEKVVAFDASADYTYQPVASNIETEYNKNSTLRVIDQFLGRVANIPNPNTPKLLNYLLGRAFDLFGDRFPDYKKYLLDETAPQPVPEQPGNTNGAPPPQMTAMSAPPVSNQNGAPMGDMEQAMRENATGETMGG
jgi:hypothetical protein